MPGKQGRDLLLKLEDEANEGVFTTIAGLRSKSISFSSETVDITNADSPNAWRELLGGGIKSANISGQGVVRDAVYENRLREIFFAQHPVSCQLHIADLGVVSGLFLVTELSIEGRYDGEVTFSISLVSAGSLISGHEG